MARALANDDTARIQITHAKLNDPPITRGLHPLGLRSERDAYLYVPKNYNSRKAAPLVVLLHGAGGEGRRTISLLQEQADAAGFLIVAPTSGGTTWDFIIDHFGPDVTFVERAINEVVSNYQVDTDHLAIGGFSDGASYALTLGITNGDIFTHILAFSPGFMLPPSRHGNPKIYVSHGTDDQVLPIDSCSRRIVPTLQQSGYPVLYDEFQGPHTVPESVASRSTKWFLK